MGLGGGGGVTFGQMTFVPTTSEAVIYTLHFLCSFSYGPNKLECLSLARVSSHQKGYMPRAILTTLHFLCNLRMGPYKLKVFMPGMGVQPSQRLHAKGNIYNTSFSL